MSDLEDRIAFIKALDALKEVKRKTYLLSENRFENTAEHSWAVSVLALVLADYAPEGVSIQKVIKMLLLHDVVEIDAGDTLLYDTHLEAEKKVNELAAATRIFGILPASQAGEFKAIWQEFEEEQSSDAIFAAALDRLIPLIHNIHTKGRAWKELGIKHSQVMAKNNKIAKASPELWNWVKGEIDSIFDKI